MMSQLDRGAPRSGRSVEARFRPGLARALLRCETTAWPFRGLDHGRRDIDSISQRAIVPDMPRGSGRSGEGEIACSPSSARPLAGVSACITNATEHRHERFKRRTETRTVPSSTGAAAVRFWAPLAFGHIVAREVGGWQTPAEKPAVAVSFGPAA